MERLTIPTVTEDPLVEVSVKGSLVIKGSDEQVVTVKTGSPEETTLEQTPEGVRVRCLEDCKIYVPNQANLRILEVNGDGVIKAVEGEISAQSIHGSLELRSVGQTTIQSISGNLEGKNIQGNLEIKSVSGNLVIRNVQGDFNAASVKGNLVLDDVDGSVNVKAKGNASMRIDPAPGAEIRVSASGNINCNLAADASVKITVEKAANLNINLPGMENARGARLPYQVTLADGDAEMFLSAGGSVTLNSQSPDWNAMPEFEIGDEVGTAASSFAEQITRQIEAQMHSFEQQLNSQLSNLNVTLDRAGLTPEQIERIQERAREASERASTRVQEKFSQAQERLERKLVQAQKHAERQARAAEARAKAVHERVDRRERRSWRAVWTQPGAPSEPAAEPVREEERLLILRMLQEKKISLQEAEALLAALEGKESQ